MRSDVAVPTLSPWRNSSLAGVVALGPERLAQSPFSTSSRDNPVTSIEASSGTWLHDRVMFQVVLGAMERKRPARVRLPTGLFAELS